VSSPRLGKRGERKIAVLERQRIHASALYLFVLHQFIQTPAEASVWIDA
jgi:hypothetical protein